MSSYPFLKADDGGGVILTLRVQPRASRTAVVGLHGEALKVAVQAPPVEGAANAAVVELVAQCFGVPKSRVEILSGEGGRSKRVRILGLSRTEAERTIQEILRA